jgi:two-component system, sporulation sensor kinase E
MSQGEIEILKRALKRERKAKEDAESYVEQRIYELYTENLSLNKKFKSQSEFQQLLIENLVDALFVVDFKGNIIQSNKEARKLIGLNSDEVFPKTIKEFKSNNYKEITSLFKNVNFKKKREITFKWAFTNRNSVEKVVMIKSRLLHNFTGEAHAIQAIVRDITTEHQLDIQLQKRYENQKVEALILKEFLAENDLLENSWSLVNHIAKYLKTDDCVFYTLVENKLIQIAATGNKVKLNTREIKNKLKIPVADGIVGYVARSKKGIIIKNTRHSKIYIKDDATRLSEIAVPVIIDDKVIGVIDSEHPEEDYYKQEQLDFLTNISNAIALKVKASIIELEKNIQNRELLITKNRLELIFNSDHNAEVVESYEGLILDLGNAFLKLFSIPLEQKNAFIGMSCSTARENLKSFFVNEEQFVTRIDELIKNQQPVLQEILELKDGRFLSRDFMPVLLNGNLDCYVWRYRDVTLSVNYEKNIEFEKSKYKRIIDNMNLGLLEVDNDDNVLSVNKSFMHMSGYSNKELFSVKAKDLLLAENSALNDVFKHSRATNKDDYSVLFELEIKTKDGTIRRWLASGSATQDINGNSYGSVWVNLDITELKNLMEKNQKLIKNLTDSNEELSHYAHLVSHDLKTPLRTISTFINWIYEDNVDSLNEESINHIKTIEDTILDMDKLISSTLQFAEIRSAEGYNNTEINLFESINHLINNNFSHFKNEFEIKLPKTLPVIEYNEVKIKQIFQNLIDNSFKYRDEKKSSYVEISFEDKSDHFLFKIKDNGIGIEDSHHQMVFRIFKKMNKRTDSSGVGLWIIKKIIENAGGKIWFESTLGIGTTFYFTVKK